MFLITGPEGVQKRFLITGPGGVKKRFFSLDNSLTGFKRGTTLTGF
jgi:hypothetical protein